MGRYTQDSWSNPSYNGNQYWGDTPFPVINGSWAQPSKMAIGRWTSTISNSLVNDAEFAYSNNRINITTGGTNPGLVNQLNSAIPTLYPQHLEERSPQASRPSGAASATTAATTTSGLSLPGTTRSTSTPSAMTSRRSPDGMPSSSASSWASTARTKTPARPAPSIPPSPPPTTRSMLPTAVSPPATTWPMC